MREGTVTALPVEEKRKRGKQPKAAGHVKVYKTAIFKIHNPSRHKRAMLKDSMKRAHLAYTRLLASFIPDVERLAAMHKKERNDEMQRRIYRFVKGLPVAQGAKAGIRIDVQGQLNSYIEPRDSQEGAQMPTAGRLNEKSVAFDAALAELAMLGSNLHRENALRDEIARLARSPRLRPVSYVPVMVQNLVDMRTGEFVSFTSSTGRLFPLEMGRSFHDAEFIKCGKPQSAKLVHRTERNGKDCDEFEVHITFEWQTPQREPDRWLGIDRGIYNLAAYVVTDDDGAVIATDRISGRELRHVQRQEEKRIAGAQRSGKLLRGYARRRAWADEAVHITANEIVRLAVAHNARVVLEDLSALSAIRRRVRIKGTRRTGFNKLLNRVQYEKLRAVLLYKLGEQGLPKPLSAALTSITCPECGHVDKENRVKSPVEDGFKMDKFACVSCGHADDADENAARVIAMKGRWLASLPKSMRAGKAPRAEAGISDNVTSSHQVLRPPTVALYQFCGRCARGRRHRTPAPWLVVPGQQLDAMALRDDFRPHLAADMPVAQFFGDVLLTTDLEALHSSLRDASGPRRSALFGRRLPSSILRPSKGPAALLAPAWTRPGALFLAVGHLQRVRSNIIALDLDPVALLSGAIGCVSALRHNALEA
jgi:IS605 OrfB family transposase